MIFLAGLVRSLVIRMVGSSWPRPATASCRSVPGYLESLAPGVSMTRTRRGLAPARAMVTAGQGRAGGLGGVGGGGVDDADSAGFGAGAGDRHRGPGAGG